MLRNLAAGLIAASIIAAPVAGSLAAATPAGAATIAKTKIVKAHRKHVRHFRLVNCFMTGSQARHVKLHNAKRFQRVACYLPTKVRLAKLHVRKHARQVVKNVKQAKQIKPVVKPAG